MCIFIVSDYTQNIEFMINFNLQTEYFPQEEIAAYYDPPAEREPEEWEVMLEQMKEAISKNEKLKAQKLMRGIEYKMHEARMKAFNKGFQQGATPLPF